MSATAKLTPEKKLEIYFYFHAGIQVKELAYTFGMPERDIHNIITEKIQESLTTKTSH